MLAEMLLYRLTRTESWVDKLGYREGAVRLWSRFGRCRRAWAPHLANTRRIVAEAAEAAPGRRTALVFGSGLLADLPLEVLAAKFARVVLVDVVHLPTVRWRTRRMANVEHIVADLTGTARGLASGRMVTPPDPGSEFGLDDASVDFVVSLNLVSQLPIAPVDWLEHRCGWTESDTAGYATRIVGAHIAHLRRFSAPVCMVGDRLRHYLDREGRVIETDDALCGIALPASDLEWDWDVAPLGEHDRTYSIRNRVFAIRELRALNTIV